jgi:glycosyltransferase involved in cell wall biosynthesis
MDNGVDDNHTHDENHKQNKMTSNLKMQDNRTPVPLVSIGLPVYNGARYLRQTLDSLVHQSFRHFEIIVSDNCSTDETTAIFAEYAEKDSRIRYFKQKELINVRRNFEFVLMQARGQFFMWAASDDYLDLDWLRLLVPHVKEDTAAFGRLQYVDTNGAPLRYLTHKSTWNLNSACASLRQARYFLEPEAFGKANVVYGLFPRNILLRYFSRIFFDDTTARYSDVVLVWKMLYDLSIASIANVNLYKRIHDDAASSGPTIKTGTHKPLLTRLKMIRLNYAQKFSLGGLGTYLRYCSPLQTPAYLILVPIKVLMSIWMISFRRGK